MNNYSGKTDYYTELKTSRFNDLKALVQGLKAISAELQKLCSWRCPPVGAIKMYAAIKKVTKPLYLLFNYKGNSEKAIRQLKEAVIYLNILIREAVKEEVVKFKTQLEKLEALAISLLPKNEGVQLVLFDVEEVTYNRQPRAFKSFLDWLDNLKYRFSGNTSVGERIGFKPLKVEQLFIRFGVS